jgi:hypothetical protein
LTGVLFFTIPGNVLDNDDPGNPAVSAIASASVTFGAATNIGCGQLIFTSDGFFTFVPTVSTSCSFTYTLDNGIGSDTATVTFTISA